MKLIPLGVDASLQRLAARLLAAVTPAADTFPYFTSVTAASTSSITAFGRLLVAVADAAAGLTLLGFANASTYYMALAGSTVPSTAGAAQTLTATNITATWNDLSNNRGVSASFVSATASERTCSKTFTGTDSGWHKLSHFSVLPGTASTHIIGGGAGLGMFRPGTDTVQIAFQVSATFSGLASVALVRQASKDAATAGPTGWPGTLYVSRTGEIWGRVRFTGAGGNVVLDLSDDGGTTVVNAYTNTVNNAFGSAGDPTEWGYTCLTAQNQLTAMCRWERKV